MLSYSPYDQVSAQAYPAMLVTTGLWDSQVQYFEPAKWVAKLRATRPTTSRCSSAPTWRRATAGKSGRFRRHQETAMQYAFALGEIDAGPDCRVRKER